MTKTIVGISGKRGSGKDTIADYLVEAHSYTRVGFADSLKYQVSELFDIPIKTFYVNSLKEIRLENFPITCNDDFSQAIYELFSIKLGREKTWLPRDILVAYGNFCRMIDENFWVKQAIAKINLLSGRFVIPDVRFLNEVEYLKSQGYQVIRVERPRELTPYQNERADDSETQLDSYENFDHTIQNNSSLEDLYERIISTLG